MKQIIVWTMFTLASFSCLPVSFTLKQVRLVGGQSPDSGRVEVYHNGAWGTVCDDFWDLRDGNVVCRMLGYSLAIKVINSAGYGQGTGPIWLDDVSCNGRESSLFNCPNSGLGNHDCRHSEDAGVKCFNTTKITVRLVGGQSPASGRVEVYFNGTWGTVCDDNWDLRDGRVVCRMLGYSLAVQVVRSAGYGRGTGPIWLGNVNCNGRESSLINCPNRGWGVSYCSHSRDAGVKCLNATTKVRLVGGQSPESGRVEVYFNGTWGTVCDNSWDLSDGNVVCRMLGYRLAIQVVGSAHYGQGTGSIWTDGLNCDGKESNLIYCPNRGWGVHNCGHNKDAGVTCLNTTSAAVKVRLVSNRPSTFGRVEIYYNGVRGRACGFNWDLQNGRVICRMLGYSHVFAAGGDRKYGRGNGPIWPSKFQCTGNEKSIVTCQHQGLGVDDCRQYSDAWVVCSNSSVKIRLKGGKHSHEGRVEINYNGAWGTVCDNGWDLRNAHVTCRMLGYSHALQASCCSKYGRGKGPALLQNVRCTGSEHSLFHCSHNRIDSVLCTGDQLAGVVCAETSATVRIRNGNTPSEGRVEVFQNGVWGTVCGKEWNLNHGHAVCRILGFNKALRVSCCAKYGKGTGPIWLYDLNCYRRENKLQSCLFWGERTRSCTHSDDAGVTCSVKARLVGSSSNTRGRVEILYNGVWGRVCGSSWDLKDGKVVCRMLGYSRALAAGSRSYGKGDGPIWMSNVRCSGTEKSIANCSHSGWGIHSCGRDNDAWVICSNTPVRLIGGSSKMEGRVEVQHRGIWGTVCDNRWDLRDGHVVCRALGYDHALQISRNSKYGQGSNTIWLDNVHCIGSESNLNNCLYSGWGIRSCTHRQEAGVKCIAKVRLADGVFPAEGRLQIYYNEAWGKVCNNRFYSDDWSVKNNHVVCRMLGFTHALYTTYYTTTVYGQKQEPTWLSSVRCNGNESNLANCPRANWGLFNCGTNRGVGLICSTYSVSLGDGSSNAEGRVEVLHNGVWSRVCAQHWDVNDGHVVCRMLGYSYAIEAGYYQEFGRSKRSTSLKNVQCKGSEMDLSTCAHSGFSAQRCNYEQDAGVKCAVPVRLAGSGSPEEGRVEVYYNRIWGAVVVNQNWNNVNVVCRMLGYTHALAPFMYAKNTPYGVKTGYIWLQDIWCTGRETNLVSCPGARWGHYRSTHDYNAALICSNKTVRLVDGHSSLVGRAEIYYRGNWRGICFTNWTMSSSHLLCRTLGYPLALAHAPLDKANTDFLNSVQCNGSEKTLTECSHHALDQSDCSEGKVVAIVCSVPIRLVAGNSSTEGRVELFYNGVWGSVCGDDWDLNDGHVVCRMLGFEYAMRVSKGSRYVNTEGYVLLNSLRCTGIENNIMYCPHGTGVCSDNDGAGVVCYQPKAVGPESNKTTERTGNWINPKTNSGYIGAVSFLSFLVAFLLVVVAVLVYRYGLHHWIITKQKNSHSERTKENANEEKSLDYEEVGFIRRTDGNREISITNPDRNRGNTTLNNADGCNTSDFTDDARPGSTAGSGGIALNSRQANVKPKKKRNDSNKVLFKHKTTHARGRTEQNIELSNTVGKRQEQSSTNVYQSLLRGNDEANDNGDEPVYSNV